MAAGDLKNVYPASSTLSTTNLGSLASSSTHVSGWESAEIDNTTNLYLDYLVSGQFFLGSGNAGEIRIWIVPKLDDNTWPGGFDGTESTETAPLDDANGTMAGAVLAKVVPVDAGSQLYRVAPFSVASAFGGFCPAKFTIFVTQDTGVNLSGLNNQVTIKGVHTKVAQS